MNKIEVKLERQSGGGASVAKHRKQVEMESPALNAFTDKRLLFGRTKGSAGWKFAGIFEAFWVPGDEQEVRPAKRMN